MEVEDKYEIQIFENEAEIPERFRGKIKEGEMLMNARSLTTDFLPSRWLKELAEDSKNQRVLYRHRDPESEKYKGRVFGRILEADIAEFEKDGEEKEAIDSWYRLFGSSKEEKALQDYVRKSHEKKEKIGISKGFMVSKKNGNIVRVFALEDSITHIPKCPACVTQDVIQMEENDMTKDKTDKEEEEIKKLREELEAATLKLEEKDGVVSELEVKLQKLEKTVKDKEDEKTSLEDKIIGLKDQVGKFEENLVYLEKKPILDEIKKLEKKQNIFDEDIFAFEKKWKIEKLENRLKDLKERDIEPQIETKTLEEEREEMEKNEEEKDIGTDKAFRNNPKLKNLIEKYKKGELV